MNVNGQKGITIALGETCIGIESNDAGFVEEMRAAYGPFLASGAPEFIIDFMLKNTLTIDEIRRILPTMKGRSEGNRYYTVPDLIDCRIYWDNARLEVQTERRLFEKATDYRLMNLLFHGIYPGIYRKIRKRDMDGFLAHGCGIVDNSRCYLFTGPSGIGKSTVARLAQSRMVLNDECVLLEKTARGIFLSGTPFEGAVLQRSPERRYLSAVILLKQAKQVSIRKLDSVEVYKRLLVQIFDTVPLFDRPNKNTFSDQADICTQIASSVPAYELSFLPDPSFWPVVEALQLPELKKELS